MDDYTCIVAITPTCTLITNVIFLNIKHNTMKKLSLVLFICASSYIVSGQKSDETPYMTRSFANAAIKNIESETSGGNITITSVPAAEARVDVFVWPSNRRNNESISKEEIEKRLQDYDLTVSATGGTLTVKAKSKKQIRDWNKALSISFRIYSPREVNTKLSTSGGNVTLNDLAGTQRFTTSGGNLNLEKLKGKIVGVTSGGNVKINNSDNDIDLTTSGGNITAENCTGKMKLLTSGGTLRLSHLNGNIDATTSGGNVNAEDIGGEMEAATSGGNVNMRDISCSLDATTSGGNIDVGIKQLGKYVRLSNHGGNIDVKLPGGKGLDLKLEADKIKTDKLANFDGRIEDEEINGKVNGGGVPVTIKASSGRINLTWQ